MPVATRDLCLTTVDGVGETILGREDHPEYCIQPGRTYEQTLRIEPIGVDKPRNRAPKPNTPNIGHRTTGRRPSCNLKFEIRNLKLILLPWNPSPNSSPN
jgi:hypothetical protein